MISRKTVGSLLLALLMGTGVMIWSQGHRDACDRIDDEDGKAAEYEDVPVGPQIVVVPCRIWFLRQPPGVQAACLAGIAAVAVFVLSASGDLKRHREGGAHHDAR